MPRRSFRYDPGTKTMVEIFRASSDIHAVIDDIEPFVSPVDGTLIQSRSQLRDYMGSRDLVFYDDAKTQEAHGDRYEKARADTALRERLWEGLDRIQSTGRSPPDTRRRERE